MKRTAMPLKSAEARRTRSVMKLQARPCVAACQNAGGQNVSSQTTGADFPRVGIIDRRGATNAIQYGSANLHAGPQRGPSGASQLRFQAYFSRGRGTIRRFHPTRRSTPSRQTNYRLDCSGCRRNESGPGSSGTTVLNSTERAWQACWGHKLSDHVAARNSPRCRQPGCDNGN
jgi:hypothetical protein